MGSSEGKCKWRRYRNGPSLRRFGRARPDHVASRDAPPKGKERPGHAVHRRGNGYRHVSGALSCLEERREPAAESEVEIHRGPRGSRCPAVTFINNSHTPTAIAARVEDRKPVERACPVTEPKRWRQMIRDLGNKSAFKARDLYTAEQAAFKAYEARVEEMKYGGQGVIPHDGNNHKGAITNALGYLAYGDEKAFEIGRAHV